MCAVKASLQLNAIVEVKKGRRKNITPLGYAYEFLN